EGLSRGEAREVTVTATPDQGEPIVFTARLRIDTPKEREYYRHGGILQYVLRQRAAAGSEARRIPRRRWSGAPPRLGAPATRSWPCLILTARSRAATPCCPTSWDSCCAIRRACRGCWASCRPACCSCCGGPTTGR